MMTAAEINVMENRARQALDTAVVDRSGISLAEVMANAALPTRIDKKFLLTPDQFTVFAEYLGSEFSVMEIDGLRSFSYRSSYLDTQEFDQYLDHHTVRHLRY